MPQARPRIVTSSPFCFIVIGRRQGIEDATKSFFSSRFRVGQNYDCCFHFLFLLFLCLADRSVHTALDRAQAVRLQESFGRVREREPIGPVWDMGLQKFSENEALNTLTGLFRDRGYDGTSLSLIMKATGLVKASLYHRFRGGKEEMAETVMDWVATGRVCFGPFGASERAGRSGGTSTRETGEEAAEVLADSGEEGLSAGPHVNSESGKSGGAGSSKSGA